MTDELKPCPFCGRNPISNEDGFVKCSYGGCGFEESLFYKNWNTRPIEDELRAELARRDEKIEELQFQLDSLCPCGSNPQDEHYLLVDEMCPIHGHPNHEIARRDEQLHDEVGQLEIATDLANRYRATLGEIYEDAEKHNTNWCKRKAQEGLGIK